MADYAKEVVDGRFVLCIAQENQSVRVGNGQQATIRRAPFSFVFVSKELDGYLVNISRSRESLDELLAGKECEGIDGLSGGSGMAERAGNTGHQVGISRDRSNYWYYRGEDNSRFDTHELVGEVHVLTRVVENLSDVDRGNVYPAGKLDADTLYVSVVTRREDSLTHDWTVYQRFGYTLTFGDTVAVSGDMVAIPEPAPPVDEQEKTAQADEDAETNEIAFDIPEMPADGECFVLIGLDTARDTVYKHSVCPDQLVRTDDGYRAWFRSLAPDALYTVEVLFPNGRSYYLFEGKRLSEL